jgi:polar amino acid transport system substrate-binding protein
MNLLMKSRRVRILAAVPVVALIALAGCSSTDAGGKEGVDTSAPLYSALPSSVKDAGTITVGSSIDYPPFESYAADGKTLQGFEPELAAELEKKLGVKFTWNNAGFDTLFTALRGNRYDIIYGAVNDTAEREQSFDFVDYLQSSQGFVVAKGNPHNIKVLDDICGKSIAAVRGGIQAQFLEAQSGECTKAGKPKVDVLTFDGNSGEQLAVKQGQAAALLENYPTAAVFAKESGGALELVPNLQVSKQHFGMVLNKDNTELRDALAKAWQAIIDDGTYATVLAKWGLSDVALQKPIINGAK